jgi:uncharacterized protein (TIGR00369 family)
LSDTTLAIATMPAHEDPHDAWMAWATAYPTLRAVNMRCVELGDRSGTFRIDEVPFPPNPNGAVNGGIVALAADQAMGILAARTAPTGSVPVTAVLSVSFHAPARLPLSLRAEVVPGGRNVSTVEVVVRGADGARCASATGTMAMGSPTRRPGQGG